jgi:hypothetical protein
MASIAKGQSYSKERLRINAEDLVDLPQEALAIAFARARRELDYIPGVAELRRLCQHDDATKIDAEIRKAWDIVIAYTSKYARWNCERDSAYIEPGSPAISQRIRDSVRRSGGWSAYLGMSPDDFPFQQKRFFEEYRAWTAVETLGDTSRLLEPAKVVRQYPQLNPPKSEIPPEQKVAPKPLPSNQTLTRDQLEDRAVEAKKRLADWTKKKKKKP